MGLEVYLMRLEFNELITANEIVRLIQNCGATLLKDKSKTKFSEFQSYYFEIRSDLGLTEMQILLYPYEANVKDLHIRFSILSPATVIDQTIGFIKNLNKTISFKIYAGRKRIPNRILEINKFKENRLRNPELEVVLNNKSRLIIEGGNQTTKYIIDNNLMDEIGRKMERLNKRQSIIEKIKNWLF